MHNIDQATELFRSLLTKQAERCKEIESEGDFVDCKNLNKIIIGVCGGDGIGPVITAAAEKVLQFLLKDEIAASKVEIRTINGLTIENRITCNKAIPDDVLEELKACHLILKGPTTTPNAADGMPNIESANVAMRKELDLFCNMRPVRVPEEGIDWTFFRENTEGPYAAGSDGIDLPGFAVDFSFTSDEGTRRIARYACEYARSNGKQRVSVVTKANVIKKTDGKFLNLCQEIAREYPELTCDSWYADIMTAKLIDQKRRRDFQVVVLPNLYGDIITDEAAEFQGGVGTAGSANIGKRYAMFEAIHGSAPRMMEEGRGIYADPCSMLRATVMLLDHAGYQEKARKLEDALDQCMAQKELVITGRDTGCTCEAYISLVMEKLRG